MPLIEGRSSASSALLLRRVFSDAAAKAPTISSGTRSTAARPASPTRPCASARRTKPVQPPVVPEVSGLREPSTSPAYRTKGHGEIRGVLFHFPHATVSLNEPESSARSAFINLAMNFAEARYANIFATPLITYSLGDVTELNASLREQILSHQSRSAGVSKSNRGGWHSEIGELEFCGEAGQRIISCMRGLADEATRRLCAEYRQPEIPGAVEGLRLGQCQSGRGFQSSARASGIDLVRNLLC